MHELPIARGAGPMKARTMSMAPLTLTAKIQKMPAFQQTAGKGVRFGAGSQNMDLPVSHHGFTYSGPNRSGNQGSLDRGGTVYSIKKDIASEGTTSRYKKIYNDGDDIDIAPDEEIEFIQRLEEFVEYKKE